MSVQNSSTETAHLSRERLHAISSAFGSTDAEIVKRVRAVAAALADGVTVKTMAEDLAAAARADANVTAVGQAMLGTARYAGDVFPGIVGTSLAAWLKRGGTADVAFVERVARRAGIKRVSETVRDALANVTDDVLTDVRLAAALDALRPVYAEVLADKRKSATPRKSASKSEPTEDGETEGASKPERMTEAGALAALREVAAYFAHGGTWSPDLATALQDATTGATAARKRGATAARVTARATVETAAA